METFEERRKCVEELKDQWKTLWRDRIDDKVRAEGISNKDYSQLFVERGTVIMATRGFKAPDFFEILQRHFSSDSDNIKNMMAVNSTIGGWGKFTRDLLNKQPPLERLKRSTSKTNFRKTNQQLKKGGKGWLHFRR